MNIKFFLAICLCLSCLISFGQSGKDHKETEIDSLDIKTTNQSHQESMDVHHQHLEVHHDITHHSKAIKANFEDFPTLHPLVVHFPIVLLLLATLSQLAGLFVFKIELSWVTLFLIAGGFIGAIVAGNFVHPHTHGLSEFAEKVLKEHEIYASYTTWLSGIALLLKVVSHFLLKRKLWGEIVVAIVLLIASYCVSLAGHYGAQLIHIEGVGVQGKYLETEGKSHQH